MLRLHGVSTDASACRDHYLSRCARMDPARDAGRWRNTGCVFVAERRAPGTHYHGSCASGRSRYDNAVRRPVLVLRRMAPEYVLPKVDGRCARRPYVDGSGKDGVSPADTLFYGARANRASHAIHERTRSALDSRGNLHDGGALYRLYRGRYLGTAVSRKSVSRAHYAT